MGLALLAWSWMRSSKRKPQENEPLVSMVLPSFGIWGVRAVSSEMALQGLSLPCPILSLLKLLFYTVWV